MAEPEMLRPAFLAHAPTGAGWDGCEALEEGLRGAWAAGRAAWPGVELGAEELVRHLARSLRAEDSPDPSFPMVNVTDLYLAAACAHQGPGAVEAFERRYLSQVPSFLGPLRVPPDQAEEVQQQLRERLLVAAPGEVPRIATYSGRGALLLWVRAAAVRRALDLRDRAEVRRRADFDSDVVPALAPGPDVELSVIKEEHRLAFERAVREAVASLAPERRSLLRLYYVEGLTLDQIGAVLRVTKATVSRRLQQAREAIAEGTRRILGAQLAMGSAEVESLAALVHSRLDLSLSSALGEP